MKTFASLIIFLFCGLGASSSALLLIGWLVVLPEILQGSGILLAIVALLMPVGYALAIIASFRNTLIFTLLGMVTLIAGTAFWIMSYFESMSGFFMFSVIPIALHVLAMLGVIIVPFAKNLEKSSGGQTP